MQGIRRQQANLHTNDICKYLGGDNNNNVKMKIMQMLIKVKLPYRHRELDKCNEDNARNVFISRYVMVLCR